MAATIRISTERASAFVRRTCPAVAVPARPCSSIAT